MSKRLEQMNVRFLQFMGGEAVKRITDLLGILTGVLLLALAISFGAKSQPFFYLVVGSVGIITFSAWNLRRTIASDRSDDA